jgi:hypothetical protein
VQPLRDPGEEPEENPGEDGEEDVEEDVEGDGEGDVEQEPEQGPEQEHEHEHQVDHEEEHQVDQEVNQDNVNNAGAEQNQSPSTSQTETEISKDYRSWQISPWMISSVIFFEISLVIIIIALERISSMRNGLRSVPRISASTVSPFSISNILNYGLLWTALPSFVLSAYRTMWEVVVDASAERQPFVELTKPRPEAANAKLTIMLDYASMAAVRSWWRAFRNGHFHLGFAMVLTFAISLGVVPLSAYLFVSAPSMTNSTTPLSSSTAFNDSAFTAKSNLQLAFNLAAAIRIYESPPPAYMTPEYAFAPFNTTSTTSGNITIPTYAYSAYLDCQEIANNSAGYSATYSPLDGGTVMFSFNDRGCNVLDQSFATASTQPKYAMSWYSSCTGQQYNRIGVFIGEHSSSSPLNLDPFTLISCAPLYTLTYGSLTVSQQNNNRPQFISFAAHNSTNVRPLFYQNLEEVLHSYRFFDPSGTFASDSFGFYTYSYALKLNSTSPYTPSVLVSATENYFTTLYASLANTMLFTPAAARSTTATLSTTSTRLFVVTPVAYSIVGVLILALICTIVLFIHASKASILKEDPAGLLGRAVLVQGSGLEAFMKEFRERHGDLSGVTKYVNNHYTVQDSRCFVDDNGMIVVDHLVEKDASTTV